MPRRTLSNIPPAMVRAYLECALWSSCDDNGTPLDRDHDTDKITRASERDARVDIRDFLSSCDDAGIPVDEYNDSSVGHDFWLTRNRHGAGFWDRGWEHGDELTKVAHTFGGIDPYVHRGRVYIRR